MASIWTTKRNRGFTLVEALISAVVLTFAAVTMAALYFGGLQAQVVRIDRAQLDSLLRSRMELLLSEKFDQLAGGTDTVTVGGTDYSIDWSVANVDLDGDLAAEDDAKQITVTLGSRSLTTIVVDSADSIGKI